MSIVINDIFINFPLLLIALPTRIDLSEDPLKSFSPDSDSAKQVTAFLCSLTSLLITARWPFISHACIGNTSIRNFN
jgi:hypothetical protein